MALTEITVYPITEEQKERIEEMLRVLTVRGSMDHEREAERLLFELKYLKKHTILQIKK